MRLYITMHGMSLSVSLYMYIYLLFLLIACTKVKDPLPVEKQADVVYEIPCTCGKVYIGQTNNFSVKLLCMHSIRP